MNADDFELDLTALQQLPETDPVEPGGFQLGSWCLVTRCNVIATKCNVIALTK